MHNVHQTSRLTQTNPHHHVCSSMHSIPVGTTHYFSTTPTICPILDTWQRPKYTSGMSLCYWDIQVLVSCRKNVNLLTCLHFEISFVLLLRILFSLNHAISSFSFRQRLLLSGERLKREHFFRIFHFIRGQNFYVLFPKILLKV